ncbi:MAG: nucleoside kinase [[Clostridium] fimetarium]|nr:nucleoside kinase [[Clostridium] fimetarium]
MKIYCENFGEYVDIRGGETLGELAETLAPRLGIEPICALVNNKTEPLQYRVFAPKQVRFLSRSERSGERVYIRSLCMMLYRALRAVLPAAKLRIEHSIAGGYYCRLFDRADGSRIEPAPAQIEALKGEMDSLRRRDIPFERKERLTKDIIEKFRAEGLDDKVELLETIHELYTTYYRLDGVIDSYYGALAPSTGCLDVFDLLPYKEGFLLMGFDRADPSRPSREKRQEKMYEAFDENQRFDRIVGVSDVGQLNKAVEEGRSSRLINVAEALHDKQIAAIADKIAAEYRRGGARVVLIAGPSSSGKTTFTKRLAIYLITNLLEPEMISLDNYFVNRDRTPRDETGDYDYESLYALDLQQFNADLSALLRGEEVRMPTYNFELGERQYKGDTLRLGPSTLLLMEGIHGLNPELTAGIPEEMKYRVYVSALTTLSIDDHNWIPTTDNRLLRRIIRDHKYRGASAIDTLRRWPSVRRGEEKWIFPFQENADAMFNSSLIFELGVMKDYGEAILREVPNDVPEYAEAYRLRRFLGYFAPIGEKSIPPTSLLREFLGGSSFRY